MRVYEFSQQFNMPSKEILNLLKKGGFELASHMSLLTDEHVKYLKQAIDSSLDKQSIDKEEEKKIFDAGLTEVEVLQDEASQNIEKKEPILKKEKFDEIKNGIIAQSMPLGQLADQLNVPSSELILNLLKENLVYNKNQILPKEIVVRLVRFYGKEIVDVIPTHDYEKKVVTISHKTQVRLPVVVVVGHVDHGKTTLLDFIRKTRLAEREKGGITQHLGAYEAKTKHGNIVFLDTPGHEAFIKMRMRGVRVADIVVLVIAADDGIMPQTVEAIRHAKSLSVPIIVAINKIDKVDTSRIEAVKSQLAKYDLLPEDWGGQTIVVPISAKQGMGVDHLLELIVLQSHMMDLSADPDIPAKCFVLESRLEKGRGPVATVICQQGQLKVGDYFVCGATFGRVNSLIDSFGKKVPLISPSVPVQVSGFDELASVGNFFEVVSQSEFIKAKNSKGKYRTPISRSLFKEDALGIMIKTDTHSSREAIVDAIERISAEKSEKQKDFYIIHSAIGDIGENDVELALSSNSEIIGFNIKVDSNARELAQQNNIKISIFNIIYKLLDHLKDLQREKVEIEFVMSKIGEAVVRKIFDIKGVGVIAGSYVKDGRFVRDGIAKVWRNSAFLKEGAIKSLQREKRSVKEVHSGYECGILIDDFSDWQIEDRIECYIRKQVTAE